MKKWKYICGLLGEFVMDTTRKCTTDKVRQVN